MEKYKVYLSKLDPIPVVMLPRSQKIDLVLDVLRQNYFTSGRSGLLWSVGEMEPTLMFASEGEGEMLFSAELSEYQLDAFLHGELHVEFAADVAATLMLTDGMSQLDMSFGVAEMGAAITRYRLVNEVDELTLADLDSMRITDIDYIMIEYD